MEHADLLYSGLMFAAGMLSVWALVLLTATFVVLAPSARKSGPSAATISSSKPQVLAGHGAEKVTPSRSVSQALPPRTVVGRSLRPVQ